ncbi:MAG: hypothetical protein EOP35_01750 [Rubrivivax sp.]|nr:MAG: hypothetical protein EOP35_01750 [Rubrivivax sp.]
MKKRSSYRPKPVHLNAVQLAIHGASKLTASEQLAKAARVRCSVEDLCASRGSMDAWADVFDTVNMIEALAAEHLFKRAREFVEAQQQNLVDVMDRHKATGSNVLRPVECAALRDLSALWAEALAEVTMRQLTAAEDRVRRKVAAVLRGKPAAGVRVLVAA